MTVELVLLFVVGLAALTLGADWLVRGASRVARAIGMNPLVIGLTVVAFGTSAPELVVSVTAALRGQPGLAVGNVMGSTVANVGLIAGLGAVVSPIAVHRRLLVRETPLLVLVLASVMALSYNGALGRLDGLALITGFAIYLRFLLRWGSREGEAEILEARAALHFNEPAAGDPEEPAGPDPAAAAGPGESGRALASSGVWPWARLLAGMGLLLLGADWLVVSAVEMARALGIPEDVIGATLVAVGTSLPELASTLAAAFRGFGDIAIGNVVGSNVFNLGLVLGAAALAAPLRLPPQTVVKEVVPALLFCLALVPLALSGGKLDRAEGGVLVAGYAGFVAWIL